MRETFDGLLDFLPRIPLGDTIEAFVDWLTNAEAFFNGLRGGIAGVTNGFLWLLELLPAVILILLLTGLAYWVVRNQEKKWGLPSLVFFGLLLIHSLEYWDDLMLTLALVLTATAISIVIGVPVGIWMARNNYVQMIITPVLDFMQTMPAFVYLIPAVAFFSIGIVPGVVASVIFAMPPTVRLTNLGIRQVPTEMIEAAEAFGSTPNQKLVKVQLPQAQVTIMAGINQTIMLALSMVVIAAMIGTDGLGREVYYAVGRNDIAMGFEAGISIVILAIMLDRMSQAFNRNAK
ncbi:ABC transporter permease [Salisediminibacterium halotolerans]|uniref:Glycine betaine/proline transport system permease protein n=1 Tax=Salisediminibacterium halotolerans TaxID=517425 RepID=A0A1H9SMW2_9BACI|nr:MULTISPECIES: proline/glycine betaine ABC transporter permease [Salisediminibacterium]RLJ73277.1 glycine betaine/proline transport system permease protein [Actinophytocola xinjiangensis]RPE86699.1 glycine betaine/proline transport system permease protein [Salisediminibacterium halotolerans]TWG34074.1 glycine betaine/proline transport system permease protein [Salisediminibacterium halotolerans]SER86254.1 glycine betaine/proline transport system permease protein [Salisediminibacterium haloalka